MRLKILSLAAAMAVAVPASAKLLDAQTGDGELFLAVFSIDDSNKVSYTLDLGVTLSEFMAVGSTTGYSRSWTVGGSIWDQFSTAVRGDLSQVQWAVMGHSQVGRNNKGSHTLLTTVNVDTFESDITDLTYNSALFNGLGNTQGRQFFDAVNSSGADPTKNTHSAVDHGESVDFSPSKGFFGEPGGTGPNLNGNLEFSAGNAVGTASNFYMLQSSASSAAELVDVSTFAGALGRATWTFDMAAALADARLAGGMYTLTYSVPVPEPASVALMVAGLAAVGAAARRRREPN